MLAEPTLLLGSAACSLLRRTLRHRTSLEDRMELAPGATNTLAVVVDESITADRIDMRRFMGRITRKVS